MGKKEILVAPCPVTSGQVRHAGRYAEMLGKSDWVLSLSYHDKKKSNSLFGINRKLYKE